MKIVSGVPTSFGFYFKPNDNITRAEAAVILNNIIKLPTPENTPVFADASAIPTWANNAISALKVNGIINGSPSGNINPQVLVNRAQCAQMMVNLVDYEDDNSKWFFGLF
mgnify:CR=1 FL=1